MILSFCQVDIPDGRLVPTLPLRLNYLLWIEDLMTLSARTDQKCTRIGVDIGRCNSFFWAKSMSTNINGGNIWLWISVYTVDMVWDIFYFLQVLDQLVFTHCLLPNSLVGACYALRQMKLAMKVQLIMLRRIVCRMRFLSRR